ncbi:hypothetical protein BKA65DRAFT_477360 [Rhexocercosporidium sp. MPI-PUGE-AT-0058]|nr:hypothetical protein BKA65DRAFT_477360 [Rhexocercosporidium sp. MPI-PUGE-AT-0058]
MTHQYPMLKLDPKMREIRLMRLVAGTDFDPETGPIRFALSKVSLNDSPTYQALSYVWGNLQDTRTAKVDGKDLQISKTLSSKPSTEELGTSVSSHDSPHASENSETSTNEYHPNADEPLWQAAVQRKHNEELFNEDDIPAITHDDGLAILDGYFPKSPVTQSWTSNALVLDTLRPSVDGNIHRDAPKPPTQPRAPESLSTLQSSDEILSAQPLAAETTAVPDSYQTEPHPVNKNILTTAIHAPLVKRTALDESSFRFGDVMKALAETTDTTRIPDLIVPGVSEYLLEDSSIDYSKIVTSGMAILDRRRGGR